VSVNIISEMVLVKWRMFGGGWIFLMDFHNLSQPVIIFYQNREPKMRME